MAGVERTQSPSERNRITATRLPEPSRSRVSVCVDTNLWLFVDGRFVDEHHRNLIANRVEPVTGYAPEPAPIGFQFHFCPASRTDQNLEEFCADCHLFIKRLVYLTRIALFNFRGKPGDVNDHSLMSAFPYNLFTPARFHPEFDAPSVDGR